MKIRTLIISIALTLTLMSANASATGTGKLKPPVANEQKSLTEYFKGWGF